MKQSWKIYRNDVKNITTNWVACIIIGGLILLPSLYAWFNIEASWDPYGQTDQIPVGIVNEDIGTTVQGEEINAGERLIETLKENEALNWQFTDRSQAMDKLEYGDYYAVIVIPDNFSEKLATVVSGSPEKSTMEYYVNEKINAIAPKITDKGASVIVEELSSQFISTVNGVIFELFNELGIELEQQLPDIKTFEQYVFTMEEELPNVYKLINGALDESHSALDIINSVQMKIPEAERATEDGLKTINDTTAMLTKAEEKLDELAPQIEADLKKAQTVAQDIHTFLNELNDAEVDLGQGDALKGQLDANLTEAIQYLNDVEHALEKLSDLNNKGENESDQNEVPQEPNAPKDDAQIIIDQAAEETANLKRTLTDIQANAADLDQFIDDKQTEINERINHLQTLSANVDERVGAFLTEYQETIAPVVHAKLQSAKTTLTTGRDILSDIQTTIPGIVAVLNKAEATLSDGENMLEGIESQYPYVNEKINELADRIRAIQGETDLNEIIDLLRNDPEAERGFFEEPVQLNKNELFPIANYGSGMTPFYTVLAIWVGGLLLISLLATDVHNKSAYTVKERYFGKMFTFLTLGLMQTTIVVLGDLFLLGVDVAAPGWFLLFGLLISLVFITIIYTVVTIFGDVGKAVAIVMLVLQIAGAGGTFPVVLLPKFFQAISPFLPFTYAIDLMREALGGVVWERALHDILFLILFGLVFLVIGTWLKKPINKHTDKLVEKSQQAGVFH
ncbi:YhgE/Pip domain-containing protein [Lentibacillus saliphilus]|uniref:YhgE/Pip domain-containing protein n=1 Tax=Lentibacillus saliphilus TaxID=2737028 RepID=UPI001C301AA8|nr:YhgE/Pip domain-containing protein [Lentibacillus saliphilus]